MSMKQFALFVAISAATLCIAPAICKAAAIEPTIHSFSSNENYPSDGLTSDFKGNLYGAAIGFDGADTSNAVIFKL